MSQRYPPRFVRLLAVLAGTLLVTCTCFAADAAPPQRVLIIHSFGRDFAPYDTIASVFRAELARRSSGPIVVYEATLDSGKTADEPRRRGHITGVSAAGARGTVGNEYTGQSTNVSHANVSGPGGNEMRTATVGNDHYADVNGNVYKNTGSGWEQHNSNGSWSSASSEGSRSMASEQEARENGERRSSASSYGGGERGYGEGFRGGGSEPASHGGFERGGGSFGGGGGRRR